MEQSGPSQGDLDKPKPKTFPNRTFIPLSLFWVMLTLFEGLHLWHRHDLLSMAGGGTLLLLCPCHTALGLIFWRLSLVNKGSNGAA